MTAFGLIVAVAMAASAGAPGLKGFQEPPKCPRGTRPEPSRDGLRRPKCVSDGAGAVVSGFERRTTPDGLSFELPKGRPVRDDWKADTPTVSVSLDEPAAGKPAMITVTKLEPRQPTYIGIEEAVARDKEWQGAGDDGTVRVAGKRARVASVPRESKSVYVPVADGVYYAVIYSAAAESYDLHLGAFERLLKTMKIASKSE